MLNFRKRAFLFFTKIWVATTTYDLLAQKLLWNLPTFIVGKTSTVTRPCNKKKMLAIYSKLGRYDLLTLGQWVVSALLHYFHTEKDFVRMTCGKSDKNITNTKPHCILPGLGLAESINNCKSKSINIILESYNLNASLIQGLSGDSHVQHKLPCRSTCPYSMVLINWNTFCLNASKTVT